MKLATRAKSAFVGLATTALLLSSCAPAAETAPAQDSDTSSSTAIPGQNITLTIGAGHPAGGAITYANRLESWFVPTLKERVANETDHTLEVVEGYGGAVATLAEVLGSLMLAHNAFCVKQCPKSSLEGQLMYNLGEKPPCAGAVPAPRRSR